jgi:hypothetical protein
MRHENTLKNPNKFPSIKVILLICAPIRMTHSRLHIIISPNAGWAAIAAGQTTIIITSITTR